MQPAGGGQYIMNPPIKVPTESNIVERSTPGVAFKSASPIMSVSGAFSQPVLGAYGSSTMPQAGPVPGGYGGLIMPQAGPVPAGYGGPTMPPAGPVPGGYGGPTMPPAGPAPGGYGGPTMPPAEQVAVGASSAIGINGVNYAQVACLPGAASKPFPWHTGEEGFEWFIAPVTIEQFLTEYFEKKPLLLQRSNPDYYRGLFTLNDFRQLVQCGGVRWGEKLSAPETVKGMSINHDGLDGSVVTIQEADAVWAKGGSYQVRQLQKSHHAEWQVCSAIETVLGSECNVNSYITPSEKQGLNAHYDNIEAFVAQVEGSKTWRLYDHFPHGELAAYTDRASDIDHRPLPPCCLEATLHPGDFLYFPRGYVHHAWTQPGVPHSTHMTFSTYCPTINTFGALVVQAVKDAVEEVAREDVRYRRGHPVSLLSKFGAHTRGAPDVAWRSAVENEVRNLLLGVQKKLDLDRTVDNCAHDIIRTRLPPFDPNAPAHETHCTYPHVHTKGPEPTPSARVRLVHPTWQRVKKTSEMLFNRPQEWELVHGFQNCRKLHMDYTDVPREARGRTILLNGCGDCPPDVLGRLTRAWPSLIPAQGIYSDFGQAGHEVLRALWGIGALEVHS